MIDVNVLSEIVSMYQRHGWVLRRLLLTDNLDKSAAIPEFSEVMILKSDVPAAWFSRPPKAPPTTWEIRFLGEPPFALLESVDETGSDFESRLRDVEDRLRQALTAKGTA